MRIPTLGRWLWRLALLLAALAVAAMLLAWWALRGSLPALDGEAALAGLAAPVTVERDALGVATIEATTQVDAMRALGYVHAQERYFEMDLLRRTAAGELAELFGPLALPVDRRRRVHRMRARVEETGLDAIDASQRPLLEAYAEGVNAGLGALRNRPWPYLLLRLAPRPWHASDSLLVGYAMYFDLQDATNTRELALWTLRPHVPEALYRLLTHPGSSWDAPLMGAAFGDAVLPDAEVLDLRRLPAPEGAESNADAAPARRTGLAWRDLPADARDYFPGSNNFAVSGALTADGRAIVADDMHLTLRAPNIWFRARLRYRDSTAPDGRVEVQGLTLPGLPGVIVGSNGHVAWGFTNSYGDYLDWSVQTPCDGAASPGPDGADCSELRSRRETIAVAGAEPATLDVRETAWGPVLHTLPDGRLLSLRWAAHQPGAVNLGLVGLASAGNLDAALAVADRTGIPTQNLLIGDASGAIAWRPLGPIPARAPGCEATGASGAPAPTGDGTALVTTPTDCPPWAIRTDIAPVLRSPQYPRLWTANARVAGGEALALLGDGGYALGARQQQIRDRLLARQGFSERDLLDIQLDDRALLLDRWHGLLRALGTRADAPALQALAEAAAHWEGRAAVDSTSYRIVRAWRLAVHGRIADGLLAPARAALGEAFVRPDLPQFEGVAWPLVTQRPAHLLPRRYPDWNALFEDAAREVEASLASQGPLAGRTWGERNTAAICHPLAGAIPVLGARLLCMPADPLPGDSGMPRVQGPDFGASQRMVVAPGHEADGILHMPGGQSGHRLSPFWGAGHADWVQGRPSPFLPGPARHTLYLRP